MTPQQLAMVLTDEYSQTMTTAQIVRKFREADKLHLLIGSLQYMPKGHYLSFIDCIAGVAHASKDIERLEIIDKDIINELIGNN